MNVIDFGDNDCAIRSLVFVTNHSYARVLKSIRANREPEIHKGTPIDIIFKYLRDSKIRYRTSNFLAGQRTRDICSHNKTGTYLVLVRNHIFALIDGIVCGTGVETYKQRVQGLWRIWPGASIPSPEDDYVERF
jgi:hypothetical protein